MSFGEIVKAVADIGLVPTVFIVVLLFYFRRTDRTIRYLEEQNKMLLEKLLERKGRSDEHR